MAVRITFDSAKRQRALVERGLDFAAAATVFAGTYFTVEDKRRDYGESRFISVGLLVGRMVMIVWTPRGDARHVISMRKTNARETRRYKAEMD